MKTNTKDEIPPLPSETFCVLPFMHAAVSPSGSFRICCNSNPKNNKLYREDGKEYKLFKDNVEDVWNSPGYIEFRRQFLAGEKPKTCERCFREEAAGIRSPREGYNEKWWRDDVEIGEEIDVDIRYVDIRLGNLCNLKCRMCNPWSSSMWVKDWNSVVDTSKTLEPSKPLTDDDMAWMEELGQWPDWKGTIRNFIKMAPTIREIYLTGGEPTLATAQYKLLEYCIDQKLAKKIKLKYNTNLTNIPPKMVDYWKHFKHVRLNASIDAVGDRDRYIRYPSNWDKVEENFDLLGKIPNVSIQIHCTVQALNIIALPEFFEWVTSKGYKDTDVYLNILNHPKCMNIRVLPPELKKQAIEKLKPYEHWLKVVEIMNYMETEDWHDQHWHEFVDFNLKTDDLQKGNLLDACPEFKGFINE